MSTAIVTGGSRGLGRALAEALALRGWDVVIDARSADELEATAAVIDSFEGELVAVPGDITDADHRRALIAAAQNLGDLRLVVNNASSLGPSPMPSLADFPLDALEAIYRTNVVAPLALIQDALADLRANGGSIINVTSDAGVEAYGGWGGYGSSKAALEQWSAVLAQEEPDLRVWWVDPGDMRTQMHQDAFPGEDISDRVLPEERIPGFVNLIEARPPSGRYRAEEWLTRPSAVGADR